MTGAYLYRLLAREGHVVDLFGKDPGTRCGISPCAWGTSRGFGELVAGAGLDSSAYVLSRPDYVLMDGLSIRADLLTFDKQRLVADLLRGAEIRYSRPLRGVYERIIDATGVWRALLPPIRDDLVLSCVQFRVRTDDILENKIELGGIGYAWCFPLAEKEYHIGCGSLLSDPGKRLKSLGWLAGSEGRLQTICGCAGTIRLTGPQGSLPFVTLDGLGEVWGVGEAIGCVAPLAGDGIVPGMRSARLLVERWDDSAGYTRAVLKEFSWMKGERKVIDQLSRGEALGPESAWVLRKNSKRMGMQVGLKEASILLSHLRDGIRDG